MEIIKSLRPSGQTRSFGIERVNPDAQQQPAPEAKLEDTRANQTTVQASPPTTLPHTESPPPTLADATTAQGIRPQLTLVIQFAVNSANIHPNSFVQLEALSRAIQSPDLEQLSFDIEGHSDASGSATFNWRLSEQRAHAISQYLQSQGVAAQRLSPKGFGPSRPIAGISPQAPANRRVVIATRL